MGEPYPPFVLLSLSSRALHPAWIRLALLRSGKRKVAPVLRKPGTAGGGGPPPMALTLVLLQSRALSSDVDTLRYSSVSCGPLVRDGDSLGLLSGSSVRIMLVLPVPSGSALAIIGGFPLCPLCGPLLVPSAIFHSSHLWFSIDLVCGFPVAPFLAYHWTPLQFPLVPFAVFHWSPLRYPTGPPYSFALVPCAVSHWSPLRFSIGPLCVFPLAPFAVSHWSPSQFPIGPLCGFPLFPSQFSLGSLCGFPLAPFASSHWPFLQLSTGLFCGFPFVSFAVSNWFSVRCFTGALCGLPLGALRFSISPQYGFALIPFAVAGWTPLRSSIGLLCGFPLVPFVVFMGTLSGFPQALVAVSIGAHAVSRGPL